jgi:hypothetical protein
VHPGVTVKITVIKKAEVKKSNMAACPWIVEDYPNTKK